MGEAGAVVSQNDEAVWVQGEPALVVPRAVGILAYPRAVEHPGTVAELVHGAGTPAVKGWLAAQRRTLVEEDPAAVTAELGRCQA